MVIAIIIAFRSERESRSAIFPIVREEEAIRAKRARIYIFAWAAVAALFLGGWLAAVGLLEDNLQDLADHPSSPDLPPASAPDQQIAILESAATEMEEIQSPEPIATDTPLPPTLPPADEPTLSSAGEASSPTETTGPTATPIPPTATPTATLIPATPTNTPEPTATPTVTPTSTLPAFVVARIPTSGPRTPAPSGARMGPIQFAPDITDDLEPVNPNTIFPQGTTEVYAVFPYSGMKDGLDFKVIWYQNGVELWRDESEWEWGDEARFFSFFKTPNEGLYKVELHVNDSVMASGLFEVR